MDQGEKRLIYKVKEDKKDASELVGVLIAKKLKTIYLRAIIDFNGVCRFEYSFDDKKYSSFGGSSQLSWASFRGARLGIYNYNNQDDAGFIDMDWFSVSD